ncbi:MAG: NAD(P)/FAD-dependent oxidoreductase [Candidatus Edwardsbacteria bacterium]|nr:NAD(P)/FAD-dependent oxidoreductase [Candidatus Edwardsbacteria bacterium]
MHDLIIIGGGPAGLGAGIQAVHCGLDVLVLERDEIGGRLRYAREIRNFPGFLNAHPSGTLLVTRLREQARRSKLHLARARCGLIDWKRPFFIVRTTYQRYRCRAVIVATGVRPKPFDARGLAAILQRVHYYWKNIPRVRRKTVAVIGGGETAFDQACSLAGQGAAVTVLVRGEKAKAHRRLLNDARKAGVRILRNAPVRSAAIQSDGRIRLVTPVGRIAADEILACIGSEPCLPAMTAAVKSRRNQGLYLAGDVRRNSYKQAAIAFGDGVQKAMMAGESISRSDRC